MKMKRSTQTVIVIALVVLVGSTVSAFADGYGPRYGRGGYGMMGSEACPGWAQGGRGGFGANLSEADTEKLEALREKFQAEIEPLQKKIYQKSLTLRSEMVNDNPNAETLLAMQKEISALKAEMAQLRLQHQLEMKKAFPDAVPLYGRGNDDSGRGIGGGGYMMRGGGYGYGPGSCWR